MLYNKIRIKIAFTRMIITWKLFQFYIKTGKLKIIIHFRNENFWLLQTIFPRLKKFICAIKLKCSNCSLRKRSINRKCKNPFFWWNNVMPISLFSLAFYVLNYFRKCSEIIKKNAIKNYVFFFFFVCFLLFNLIKKIINILHINVFSSYCKYSLMHCFQACF